MSLELWRLEEVDLLVKLAHEGVPLSIVSMQLGRDIGEVERKAAELGLTRKLAEARQSPHVSQDSSDPKSSGGGS